MMFEITGLISSWFRWVKFY